MRRLLLAAAVLFAGCLAAVATPAQLEWPEPTAMTLYTVDESIGGWVGWRVRSGSTAPVTDAALEPVTALVNAAAPELGLEKLAVELEGPMSYVISLRQQEAGDGGRYSVFASGRLEGDTLLVSRTWFRLVREATAEPRGLAVLMPGMFGTPEDVVQRVENELRRSGWAVLRMLAPPARTTERFVLTVSPDLPTEAVAKTLATELDRRAAEPAYAVRAAIADAIRRRPALEPLSLVAIGMSGSAITMPAVLALDPGAFDAAVFVAGGTNSAAIARESNYKGWIDSVHVEWSEGEPTPRELAGFDAAYLAHARLDGHHLAPRLTELPTLVMHGTADRAVPARYGDELWRRLGRPERWTVPFGHELLFGSLMLRAPQIVSWLNEATADVDDR
ncbi:MAG: alpha/beta hydrolase [Planctomycetota bacterium]